MLKHNNEKFCIHTVLFMQPFIREKTDIIYQIVNILIRCLSVERSEENQYLQFEMTSTLVRYLDNL